MKNICLTVQYDGTKYKGWQRQGNTEDTIQSKLENVLNRMTGEKIEINASGRTDAGVHANGQVINFHTEKNMQPEEIKKYMNSFLPEDITILSAKEVSERFHARYNVGTKVYSYKIDLSEKADVFLRKYTWNIPLNLNIEEMKKASENLIGTHDFKSFTDTKKSNKSSIKTIEKIDIFKKGNIVNITITGDGFLYHMVRIIVGTLVEVGCNKISAEKTKEILKSKSRAEAGEIAPAKGLTLEKVLY